MDMPEYKYIYTKTKCNKKSIYVTIEKQYRYIPDKNVYRFEKGTCNVYKGWLKTHKCNGIDLYNRPCELINPLPYDMSPDAPEFLEENWEKRLTE